MGFKVKNKGTKLDENTKGTATCAIGTVTSDERTWTVIKSTKPEAQKFAKQNRGGIYKSIKITEEKPLFDEDESYFAVRMSTKAEKRGKRGKK